MGDVVRGLVATLLLFSLFALIAASAAGASLVLGWAEAHPNVTDVVAWVAGAVVVAAAAFASMRVWFYLYARLGQSDDD